MREMVAAVGFPFYVPIPHSLFPRFLLCTLLQVDRRPLFLANYLPYRVEDLPSIPLRWGHPPSHSPCVQIPPSHGRNGKRFLSPSSFSPISFISPCDGRRSFAHCRQIISQINF